MCDNDTQSVGDTCMLHRILEPITAIENICLHVLADLESHNGVIIVTVRVYAIGYYNYHGYLPLVNHIMSWSCHMHVNEVMLYAWILLGGIIQKLW